ncbi:MAG TPA: alpha/beta hydrolase [Nannocystis sp.]|jgi:pimeloyl-ACP methyl ester carboxylesterase
MPELITIPDRVAGPGVLGRVRVDRRAAQAGGEPSLVILGGMTQTLASWGGQVRPLSAGREVLVYEARGQGQSELAITDVSPARHVEDFAALLAALAIPGPVDLCGFSFGGRIALAIAATRPELVRRLIVTGVSAGRGALGRVIVRAWQASLATGNLEALAWLSLADTLGPAYLDRNEHMLAGMVQATMSRNRYEGIRALFEQTLADDPAWEFHPTRLAPRIACPTLLLAGAHDRLAPELDSLAAVFAGPVTHHIVPDVGHTVAIEAPEVWRAHVLEFLAAPSHE